mmetsp:Transcript_115304/g.330965  ORF Transcript_115304/g.330965 Transcript_115304/m.330965 type:complete len:139 (+) Transcript_115304:101-517(+)|eukprot:CAMPEP_0170257566 /NCGR_PEP_ID=MMETSP0116_2-20130129/28645_1 /TAXON_ID=400756 /ORGANISM="Durinskia baltica, Strain CSIRO CS-38" /LENGTH=138 /DNA_ID=CAMNT_0010508593 /DNA_START=100 /DNA_END=516 /DNA_ORIENTATION=-
MARRYAKTVLLAVGLFAGASALQAGPDMSSQDDALHGQMQRMMADDDSDDIETRMARRSGDFLQVKGGAGAEAGKSAEEDPYLEESQNSLSAALGPRWDSRKLDDDADRNTQALLRGISGGRTMTAIKHMMSAMSAMG